MTRERCICGHTRVSHDPEGCSPVYGWGMPKPTCPKDCKQFQLDNLQLIEDLAKEKGL